MQVWQNRLTHTGKLVKKKTGWLGNNEHILNRLAKQCNCPPGSHEQIVGASRSKEAAVYPKQLCEEILLGLEDSMTSDYVAFQQKRQEAAFPVEEEMPELDSNDELLKELGEPATPRESQPIPAPATPSNILRRRPRVQEVKKGAWERVHGPATLELLRRILTWKVEPGAVDWAVLEQEHELTQQLREQETGQTEVQVVLVSRLARRMKRPQPHAGPMEVPLRKALILMDNDEVLSSGWEEWHKLATQQNRTLPTRSKQVVVVLFGTDNAAAAEELEEPKEEDASNRWQRVYHESFA